MTWAMQMAGLMADNSGVGDGQRKRGVDDGIALCLCGLGEYPQLQLLARKSCHCLILPTTFLTLWIVLLVGIVRVRIQDSKP